MYDDDFDGIDYPINDDYDLDVDFTDYGLTIGGDSDLMNEF